MLQALCGPAVLYLILFGFARLTSGYFWPGIYFCMDRVLFLDIFCYYTVFHCFCSWGGGSSRLRWDVGGGSLSRGFTGFLGWSPRVGRFGNLGLGLVTKVRGSWF